MDDDQSLDALILSQLKPGWLKTARVIATVLEQLGADLADEKAADSVADRIIQLARAGRLESQGDLSRWRFSEVRLPAAKPGKDES